jgi:hypothetical protein
MLTVVNIFRTPGVLFPLGDRGAAMRDLPFKCILNYLMVKNSNAEDLCSKQCYMSSLHH